MKKRHYLILAFLFFISLEAKPQANASIEVNGRKIQISYLEAQLLKMMNDVGFPGMSVAVIDHNKIVFNKAYGVRGVDQKKPVTSSTVFETCSLSKTYFVYVAHQLVDQGKLDLDKPIYQYLDNDRLKHDPRYKLITPRMILSHSSGIENWQANNQGDVLEIMADPGTAHVYSGEGYNYLAEVAGLILGESHEAYMDRMVMKPLKLKNTFLKFTSNKPSNFAFGHSSFNVQGDKWKNKAPLPSSGVNSTTADYAQVLIAIFENLSKDRIREIMTPNVRARPKDPHNLWAPGFMLHYGANDTLVMQGGSNGGYKSFAVYSPSKKSGFVYFTNNDRGWTIGPWINKLTTQFDSTFLVSDNYESYYPSQATDLLKIYRQAGRQPMFDHVDKLLQQQQLNVNALNEVAGEFRWADDDIARQLLQTNIRAFPVDPVAFHLIAELYMDHGEYALAVDHLQKAKTLDLPNASSIEKELISYTEELNKRTIVCGAVNAIAPSSSTTIEAEAFCKASGVRIGTTKDTAGGGELIGWTDDGDWIEYEIDVESPREYRLDLRIASPQGMGKIELFAKNKLIRSLDDFPVTKDWDVYQTLTTTVALEAGRQTLKLGIKQGNFDLNWFRFYANQLEKASTK